MSEKLLLVDKDNVFTYGRLLSDISSENYYYPFLKTSSLYEFIKNLSKAVFSNNPITLLDSDLSDKEIAGLEIGNINQKHNLDSFQITNFNDLINSFYNSNSEITIFTSGTTGQPKKIIHTLSTLTRSVRKAERYENHVWAFAYNPTHMAGIQVFFQAFYNTNTLVNVFNRDRNYVYSQIEKYNVTHISATPTFYRLLLPLENQFDLVERVTFGGEKSDDKLHNNIRQIFPNAKVNNIYASTEAGSLFVSNGEFFKIPKDIKEFVKVESNELLIHKSLLGASEGFIFEKDFYRTGDLIEWIDNSQDLFRFISRKNELINIGGYKVNPEEVEGELLKINEVQQAIVYGRANSVLGNILCAEVQLVNNDKNMISEKEVKMHLANNLQDYKIPRIIKFVDSIQLTRTGKIKRK